MYPFQISPSFRSIPLPQHFLEQSKKCVRMGLTGLEISEEALDSDFILDPLGFFKHLSVDLLPSFQAALFAQ